MDIKVTFESFLFRSGKCSYQFGTRFGRGERRGEHDGNVSRFCREDSGWFDRQHGRADQSSGVSSFAV